MWSLASRATILSLTLRAITGVSAGASLSLRVSAPSSVLGVENLRVTAILTNTGSEKLTLLNDPLSPLSRLPTNTFSITDGSGEQPAFVGAKAKYSPQVAASQNIPNSVTVLEPGQSTSVDHDIAQAYNFTTSGPGEYYIEANNLFYRVLDSGEVDTIWAESEAQATTLTGTLGIAFSIGSPSLANFVGCSASRQAVINAGIAGAEQYALASYEYINATTNGTSRYTTWFGSYTASRRSTVVSHFNNINNNNFSSFTYDCSCTDSAYAYVFPDQFGQIYLCNAFWSAPTLGTDSTAGTIIHESSHFTKNGGTDDHAYGQSACKSLATSSPSRAVMNADSHEYFAENNPLLS